MEAADELALRDRTQLLDHLHGTGARRRSAAPRGSRTDATPTLRQRVPRARRARRRGDGAGAARPRLPTARLADRRVRLDQAREELGLQPLLWQQPLDPGRERERLRVEQHQLLLDAERQAAAEAIAHEQRGRAGPPPPTRSTRRSARSRSRRDDPRVAADLHRALRVPEQVRIVALLPDEDEVRRGHEVGHERAAVGRAGKGIGANAEPAGVVVVGVVDPVELVLLEQLVHRDQRPPPRFLRFHGGKVRRMGSVSGGVRGHNEHMSERDVAIVLSGGGVNGVLLQLGFLKRLRESELWPRVGCIYGTSAGALTGIDGRARPARRPGGVHARPAAARRLRARSGSGSCR